MPFLAAMPVLAAALLFGASTPVAKLLVGDMSPLLLAGLLYLGSGVGLGLVLAVRAWRPGRRGAHADAAHAHAFHGVRSDVEPSEALGDRPSAATRSDALRAALPRADLPWLLAAIFFGGVLGPALLMLGLGRIDAASATLLLNVEGVLTALLAWVVFRENTDARVATGMVAIVAGGALLSWSPGGASFLHGSASWSPGALLVVGACLCWAIDNNLTRRVAANDAMLIACVKGLLAGMVNTTLALAATGATLPAPSLLAACLVTGFFGYGLSLTLFVVGLRTLGAARTGAWFCVAPLFGVIVALAIWPALPGALFWVAAALMALGVWLHVSEHHEHEHAHDAIEHRHRHRHDEHHRHAHDFPWDGQEPHVHAHRHEALTHRHPHYPDVHHRHGHVP